MMTDDVFPATDKGPADTSSASADRAGLPAFEPSLARIEEIVRLLEDGRTDLETALARYEEGVILLRHCHELLRGGQRRIEMLRGVDAEGRPILDTMNESDFRTRVETDG